MKDYNNYLNKQAQILNEFDDFCEQFEKRASESFAVPKNDDNKIELFDNGPEDRTNAPILITEDRGLGARD
jgi:F0F1-type ATP synthase gamma subunit